MVVILTSLCKQERLDFLYESGLAVGKGTSGFKALESLPKNEPENAAHSSSVANSVTATAQQSAVPGALFEEKPQSANDTWRKLHSDPLLLIRRREQEALARVKNNPVQTAMIHKSVSVPVSMQHSKESSERGDRRKRDYDKQYKEGQSGGHQDTKYNSGRKRWKGHYEFEHQEYSSERRQVKSLKWV